ncbi:hypothetical protein JNW90_16810 [Micromonospora sp. STR1s_5]|nr:hypothetical protein [Micromonospora sp. STR1s_5]
MQVESANPEPFPVVVFGLDDQGKGHASRFEPADAQLAEKAAGLMGMRVLRLTTAEQLALAAELPKGRVFGSGKAFVPFVSRSRFDRLAAAPGAFVPEYPPVDDGSSASGKPTSGDAGSASVDASNPTSEGAGSPGVPASDWSSISNGSLVLAAEEHNPGIWYVATVVSQRGEDLLELQWFDWPDEPLAVRRREHLGLFPAALAEALA